MSNRTYSSVSIINVNDGAKGDQGVSVSNIIPQYYLSTSSSELIGGSWSEAKPEVTNGTYLWTRQKNIFSDGAITYSTAVCDVTISGIIFDVDKLNQDITSKIWESDITSKINQYDGSTGKNIRDRVTQTEEDIDGLTSTVSDIETVVDTKADGSTVTSLTQRISAAEQDVSGFKTTVAATYAVKGDVSEFIVGTQTTNTAIFQGKSQYLTSLVDGTQITYWLPYSYVNTDSFNYTPVGGSAAGGVGFKLTFKDDTVSDIIPCFYGGTQRLTSHYAAGNIIRLVYRENVVVSNVTIARGWWADANYNTNNYDRLKYNGVIKAKTNLTRYGLAVSDGNGFFNLNSGNSFSINCPILYMQDGSINAGSSASYGYVVYPGTITTTQAIDLVPGKSLYIRGTLNGLTFTPYSVAPITQTEPLWEDGYHYMFLGTAYGTATTVRTFYLLEQHPIYIYKDGIGFVRVETAALTIAEQTEAGFRWIVSSGTSATDFQLTDRTADLIAEYINLNGKVTFNGLNSNTQTLINNAINDAQTATSTANSATTIANNANSTANAVQDSLNNLEIGGRNILRGTAYMCKGVGTWESATFRDSTAGAEYNVEIYDSPVPNVDKGVIITPATVNKESGFAQDHAPLKGNASVCMSVWAKGQPGDKLRIQPYWTNKEGEAESSSQTFTIEDTSWHRYHVVGTTEYNHQSISIGYVYYQTDTLGNSVTIVAPKVEYGNIPTDWTQAQEDTEENISRVVEENMSSYRDEKSVIIGTQTHATSIFTGNAKFNTLIDGMEITYWLPYAYSSGDMVSYTPSGGTASNGDVLNLTLANGTTTGNIPCFYSGISRLTSHYGAGNVIHFLYRENVTIGNATVDRGFWADANYDSNTYDRLRYNQNVTADSSGYTAVNIIVGNNGRYHNLKTGGAFDVSYPILYAASTIGANASGNNNYLCLPFTSTTTQNSTWVAGKPVYIKGKLNKTLFTPINSTPLTQTIPATEDGYQYILLGNAYSTTGIYLTYDHGIYQYYDNGFKNVTQIATEAAVLAGEAQTTANLAKNWVDTIGENAKEILATWTNDASLATTVIDGGYIKTHTIESQHLATDAIMSNNFVASQNGNSPYSAVGSFLNLENGNFYTQNFGIDNVHGKAYINGEIIADSGSIGLDDTNYWEIGTFTDYNGDDSAALIGHGSSFLQSGWWQISDDRINTQKYTNNYQLTYPTYNSKYYDYGMKMPDYTSSVNGSDAWLYIRRSVSNSIPTIEADWNYLFKVDKDGNVYEGGVKLSEKYALISDVGSAYVPTTGGTINGNLTVTGTISGTATKANVLANARTIRTNLASTSTASFDGSANVSPGVTGTLGVGNGGTGQTTLVNAANSFINALTVNSSDITDSDYFISQYPGGGTTTTTYHRHLMSGLWTYIQNKLISIYDIGGLRSLTNNEFDEANITELTSGNLIVTGTGRFTNGLYGNLTGNVVGTASNASKVENNLVIKLNSGTTEGTNQFTYNGSAIKNINITKSSIGLGNVDNTPDSEKSVLSASTLTNTRQLDGISFNGNGNIVRYGVCDTAAATAAKVVSVNSGSNFNLVLGATIFVKFTNTNTIANPTLNVNNTGAIPIKLYGTTAASTSTNSSWYAGSIMGFVYDGTNWLELSFGYHGNDNHIPQGYCGTASGTAAKSVSCTNYYLAPNSHLMVLFTNANTAQGAITLNVNGKGAKPLYINGSPSSASNYEFPAGSYFTFYDGTNFYLRTDGQLTASITGTAARAIADGDGNTISSSYLKTSGGTITGTLILSKTTDLSGTSNTSPALIIGTATGQHLEFDINEIHSKSTGTTTGTLYINTDGGIVYLSNGSKIYANNGTMTATTFVGSLSGNATSSDHLSSTRSLTIGDSSKTTDWSGNVSFTKAEISGNASSSTSGWMSASDKSKLDSINVSQIGTVEASSIIGTGGINVTVTDGVATIKHSNSAITAGTTSGTSNSGNVAFGSTVTLPKITYDAYGHITSVGTYTFKLPAAPTSVATATKFSSARTIALTNDVTGTASSDGESGWSISTKVDKITVTALSNVDLNDYHDLHCVKFHYGGGSNGVTNHPLTDGLQFGMYTYATAAGHMTQELSSFSDSAHHGKWMRWWHNDIWSAWEKVVTSKNYTDYTVTKTGSGASGTWGISISGTATNATNATNDSDGNPINSTYLKLSGGTMSGNTTFNKTKGIYFTDTSGTIYAGIYDNGNNLWIGATSGGGNHHRGASGITYISTGLNTTTGLGNPTIGIAIPTLTDNKWSCVYGDVLHSINYSEYALPITGGTLTGDLIIQKTSTISANSPAKISFKNIQSDNNVTSNTAFIAVYDDHDTAAYGTNMVIQSAGNVIIGSGESPTNYYTENLVNNTGEILYFTSDNSIYFATNCQTIANKKQAILDQNLAFHPLVTNTGSIGTSSYVWDSMYANTFYGALSGNATSATSATNDGNGDNISLTYAKLSGATFTGDVNTKVLKASNYVAVNSGQSGVSGGIALYATAVTAYGLAMRTTANSGVHGYVNGAYGIYSYMADDDSLKRGWIWRTNNTTNVASISTSGNAVFNGSVTVGGNSANTSGCRLVYSESDKCLDFVFE